MSTELEFAEPMETPQESYIPSAGQDFFNGANQGSNADLIWDSGKTATNNFESHTSADKAQAEERRRQSIGRTNYITSSFVGGKTLSGDKIRDFLEKEANEQLNQEEREEITEAQENLDDEEIEAAAEITGLDTKTDAETGKTTLINEDAPTEQDTQAAKTVAVLDQFGTVEEAMEDPEGRAALEEIAQENAQKEAEMGTSPANVEAPPPAPAPPKSDETEIGEIISSPTTSVASNVTADQNTISSMSDFSAASAPVTDPATAPTIEQPVITPVTQDVSIPSLQ